VSKDVWSFLSIRWTARKVSLVPSGLIPVVEGLKYFPEKICTSELYLNLFNIFNTENSIIIFGIKFSIQNLKFLISMHHLNKLICVQIAVSIQLDP